MKNEGSVDRVIRIVAGLALLSLLFLLQGPAHWFGLIGLVPLLTGLVGGVPDVQSARDSYLFVAAGRQIVRIE